MKRFFILALLVSGFGFRGQAAPETLYLNSATLTNAPQVDAITFLNQGTIAFDSVVQNVNNNGYNDGDAPADNADQYTAFPYTTRDTLFYTNISTGVLEAIPGFQFETVTGGGVKSADTFVNDGTILGVDFPTPPAVYTTTTGSTAVPQFSQIIPSLVQVNGVNVLNDGLMAVGNGGLLQMTGDTVDTSRGQLVAGALNTAGASVDAFDSTGQMGLDLNGNYYVNPPGVYDLFWGTGTGTQDITTFNPPNTFGVEQIVDVEERGGNGGLFILPFPINGNGKFASYVYGATSDPSNTFFNVVFVNTNFIGQNGQTESNISASVGFVPGATFFVVTTNETNLLAGTVMVQFAEAVPDVITGTTVTNAVWVLDDGGVEIGFFDDVNAGTADVYSRPNNLAITTTVPPGWPGFPANLTFDPGLIFQPDTYQNTDVTFVGSEYGVQIGRNPSTVNGNFNFGEVVQVALPDPTNEPGRIELNANNLILSNSLLRAEGMVTINATNIMGTPAGIDWGEINSQLGASSGNLLVSNFYPSTFNRLRGDIYTYTADWVNLVTNGFTNLYHIHALIVDQNLQGSFPSAIRNLTLNGATSVNVKDQLYVINQAVINTPNLTISTNVVFTQNANSFLQTNAPELNNFLVDTNGSFSVDNVFDIGLDQGANDLSPMGRRYSVSSIENMGQIQATASLFQSAFFENDGNMTTVNGGSMTVEAGTLNMGLMLTNQRNTMTSSGNITLSAANIGVTNSSISVQGTLTLESAPDGQITDFIPGSPATQNVLNNFWQVNGGFSLPVKPARGDLFGTQITTVAAGHTTAHTVWAGRGVGGPDGYTNALDGFTNNVVIGKLVLSRQSTNAELRFSGVASNSAMYVDYLELDPNSLSFQQYQSGLVIDPNLTIYFANANVNPIKLQTAYPKRLVWVTNFWGPNSTVLVTNELNLKQFCAVNAAVADSLDPSVSYFPGTLNAFNQPYPLNNPNPPFNWYYGTNECPQVMINTENFSTPTEVFANGKNAFASVKGVYNGLFMPTNNVAGTNSGFITFTLAAGGTYSGKLMVGASNYLFSGSGSNKFNYSGAATTVAKHGAQSLNVSLQLVDTSDGTPGGVTGYVSNQLWTAPLEGEVNPTYTSKITSPYEGQYTLILTNESTNSGPVGYSYGSVSVNRQGMLTIIGKLADGNSFSQSVPLSSDGLWPFYSYVGKGNDVVEGWISFQLNEVNTPSIINTNVLWTKAPNARDKYFPAGFTNSFGLESSIYASLGRNTSPLNLFEPQVIFSGDNLSFSNFPVAYNLKSSYSSPNLTLSMNPAAGTFAGRLKLSGQPPITVDGVVLQDQGGGFGFFLGTNGESGGVLLQSQSQ